MKNIYLVTKNADTMEGRGPMLPEIAFVKREDAIEYMAKRPGIGGKYATWSGAGDTRHFGDRTVQTFQLLENLDEVDNLAEILARAAALAKLTDYERGLLGIKE